MKTFNNIKVNTKILLGFLIILVLMGIIGGVALFQVTKINATVTNLIDNLAKDQHLADQMVSKILLARFYANKYIREQKPEDLNRFNKEFADFEKLLVEADQKINKPERIEMLVTIKEGVQTYDKYFKQVIKLTEQRYEIIHEMLDVQGPLAEEKLEQLRESAFKANDGIAAFYAANFQRTLLLMRLDVFKYLQKGEQRWSKKFNKRYQESQIAFNKLEQELQDPTRRRLAQQAQVAIELYHKGFIGLQTNYAQQNKIVKTQLDIIGPKIRKNASKMSASVNIDFNQENQATQTLVTRTWLELLIIMGLAIFIGLGFGFLISRSITNPLKMMVEMSDHLLAGNMDQLVAIQNDDNLNQIINRQDEIGNIMRVFNALATYFPVVIEDIVQISQGLATGDLTVKPQSEYRGNFIQIKNTLETTISNQRQVIGDIVQVSQQIAEGKSITFQAEYYGDFAQTRKALEMAASKLADTMDKNTQQDWLKTGQNQLNEQMSGVQNIVELTHNIVSFLTFYLEAQVGICYLINETPNMHQSHQLEIVASYAQTRRKNLTEEFQFSEGLVERAAKELETLVIKIEAGLEDEFMPRYLIMMPFLYENRIKGVLVLGALEIFTPIQHDFLHQVRSSIGIAVNSVESQTQMQQLLQQSQTQAEELQSQRIQLQQSNDELQSQSEELQNQTEELQSQTEELQSQAEELRQTNEALEIRSRELELQKTEISDQNLALEKTQRVLEAKAQELELASRYKSEFLANMSHELRTPLNSLLILSQLLVDNKSANLTEKQIEYAQTIHSAGADLLGLINDILDLSKVEAGKIEVNLEEISVTDFIEALKLKFSPVAENKGLTFHLNVADEVPAVLNTDGQRLNQIINNLLANAFKFTHEGEIKLTVQCSTVQSLLTPPLQTEALALENFSNSPLSQLASGKNLILISVSDTGIGIPKDKQQVIFEAFQQADGTTSRRYGGTGLGLSISRQLARLLGGDLQLQCEEGKGSTFTLYLPETHSLPMKTSTSATPSSVSLDEVKNSSHHLLGENIADDRYEVKSIDKSILIIEDDRKFSRILMEFAKEKQFKCLLAEDGRTGLQLAQEYKPTAIILDIGLPQIDGWTVMEQLKDNSETRHIPVYFLSAADQSLAAKKMGALGYLVKPINMVQLENVFGELEQFLTQTTKKLLIIVDNQIHQQKIQELVMEENIQMTCEITIEAAFQRLQTVKYDCIVLDLDIEQDAGCQLLKKMQSQKELSQVPVVVYAEHDLNAEQEILLQQCAKRIPIKLVHSVASLLDEATLFLHQNDAKLSEEKRNLLKMVHDKTAILKNKQVLIVDDDVRNTFALATVLEDKQMEVISASNGEEALEQLKTHQDIAIVLMDIMMPKMDGYEATRQIRKQPGYRKLPIIALTAKAMKGDKAKCIEAGANDYLSKPIDTDKLISLMRVWLCH